MPRLRQRRRHEPPAPKPPDLNLELTRRVEAAGVRLPSACGTCGATVAADDDTAVRDPARTIGYGALAQTGEPTWWRHRWCHAGSDRPGRLALLLCDPDRFPLDEIWSRAVAEVSRKMGSPVPYCALGGVAWTDLGSDRPWQHVSAADRVRLRAAIEQRHAELTVPVRSADRLPCSVCGRSHDLLDAWGRHDDRPVCGECLRLVHTSAPRVPGNPPLRRRAFELAGRAGTLPDRGVAEMLLRHEAGDYAPLDDGPPVLPWEYARTLPEPALSVAEQLEQRLAELEARAV